MNKITKLIVDLDIMFLLNLKSKILHFACIILPFICISIRRINEGHVF